MRKPAAGWGDLLRALARAFRELLRSEVEALGEDLAGSARRLAVIAGLFLLALFALFWAVGLITYTSVELLSIWMPRWAAALVVLFVVLLISLGLAAVGRARLRRLEKPTATVRRHVAEHVEWWETRVLGEGGDESTSEDQP